MSQRSHEPPTASEHRLGELLVFAEAARGDVPVSGLEEFGDLRPVRFIRTVEAHREPAAITVVR